MNDICGRFFFAKDMNGDFAFTVSDVWLFAKTVYLLPAKIVAASVQGGSVGNFFEVTCSTGEGIGGAVFSLIVWIIVLVLVFALLSDAVEALKAK